MEVVNQSPAIEELMTIVHGKQSVLFGGRQTAMRPVRHPHVPAIPKEIGT